MFTRRQAAQRNEEQIGMDLKETEDGSSVLHSSQDQEVAESTAEESLPENEEAYFTDGLAEPITHSIPSPQLTVQGSQQENVHAHLNKRHKSLTKSKPPPLICETEIPFQVEGDHLNVDADSGMDMTRNNMLDSFGKMINGALQRMTEALGNMFRTTIQEVRSEEKIKGDENKSKRDRNMKSRSSSLVKNQVYKRALHSVDHKYESDSSSDSESDDENHGTGSSVSTSKIFHQKVSSSIKLPAFKGESNEKWVAYINRFEAVAHHYEWSDKEKLGQLLPRLQGSAGEFVYEELEPKTLRNYGKLKKELGYRFGLIETKKSYQTKFRCRNQNHSESVQSYASELKSLYSKAFPNRDQRTKQEDLVSRFLLGLANEKSRIHVELNRDPKTIEEATEFVVEYEAVTGFSQTDGNMSHKKPVRQVKNSNSTPDTSEKVSQADKGKQREATHDKDSQRRDQAFITRAELKQLLQEVLSTNHTSDKEQKQRKPLICYKCGEHGHFANKCPNGRKQQGTSDSKPLDPGAVNFKPSLN